MENNKTAVLRKICKIAGIVLFAVLAAAFALMLIVLAVFKRGNDAPQLLGYKFFLMSDASMSDSVPQGSFVTAKVLKTEDEVGNVIFYRNSDGGMSVGRITEKQGEGELLLYKVKPDLSSEITEVKANDAVARVVGVSTKLGTMLRFATSYRGVFLIAILPCGLLILLEIILSLSKAKKPEEESAEEEIAEEKEEKKPGKYADKSLSNELVKEQKKATEEEDGDDVVLVKQGEAADIFAKAAKESEESGSEKTPEKV